MGTVSGLGPRLKWNHYRKIAVDSNCFIYLIEGSPYERFLLSMFRSIERGEVKAVTSALTIAELMVGPYRSGDRNVQNQYRMALCGFRNLEFRAVDADVADLAAKLRVKCGLKTPDAIQLATAMASGADVFVTNDRDFRRAGFPVLFLSPEGLSDGENETGDADDGGPVGESEEI